MRKSLIPASKKFFLLLFFLQSSPMRSQMRITCFVLFALFSSGKSFSQKIDSIPQAKKLSIPIPGKDSSAIIISAYVDAYYAYYTDSVKSEYQQFPTVSPKSNSFGLNVAHFNFQYDGPKVRGVVALHFGDIQRSAWAGNIMEAHAGVRLCKKLWLDGGFFRTHVGTEGLLPKENIASSIAVCTYMEPYFESGVRFNYNPNDKLILNFYVLNGYNIYQDNNKKKSVGLLATYAINDNFNIGYSNYIGDDSPIGDIISRMRLLNNVFVNFQAKKIKMQLGGDYGIQKTNDPNDPAVVMSSLASFRYQLQKKAAIYIRGEYFSDAQGVLSGTYINKNNQVGGLTIWGMTTGLEYKPTDNSYIRLEGRQLNAEKTNVFYWDGKATNIRNEVMIHMGVSF